MLIGLGISPVGHAEFTTIIAPDLGPFSPSYPAIDIVLP